MREEGARRSVRADGRAAARKPRADLGEVGDFRASGEVPGGQVDKALRPPLSAAAYLDILIPCPGGGIGRRTSFRCWRSQGRGGSSPLLGTIAVCSRSGGSAKPAIRA